MRHLLPLVLAAACTAPDLDAAFTDLDVAVHTEAADANALFSDVAAEAEVDLRVALPGLVDPDLTDDLLAAHDRGVDVLVVTDWDRRDDVGVAALIDAGLDVTLADGDLTYFEFTLNDEVAWDSELVQMTHAFAVADRTRLVMATRAGHTDPGPVVTFSGRSEDLGEDLVAEHVQVHGGTDATALTAFDAMAKSIADARWIYPTQTDELVELWLGPQQRVVKRLIDGVYRARSSIRVLTEDFADEGLARALQHKVDDGFDVEVIVGRSFGTANPAISEVLLSQAPGVPVLRTTRDEPLPTLVFVDLTRARDGQYHMPVAMIATHPIWSASRLFSDVEVVTDQLCDGALYVVSDHDAPGATLGLLASTYDDIRQSTEALR